MSRPGTVRAPHPRLQALEAAWLPAEAVGFAGLRPWLRGLPGGDGHPVLVLPGFTTTDRSTQAMRAVLREKGYWAHGWRLGRNIGPTARLWTACGDGSRSCTTATNGA